MHPNRGLYAQDLQKSVILKRDDAKQAGYEHALMIRWLLSLILGLGVGLAIGVVVGWFVAPVEFTDSPISDLAPEYQDAYALMVASGYLLDGDLNAAIERLRLLEVPNVMDYVQQYAERCITQSCDLNSIRTLVALAEGLGRLTPPMENFRQYSLAEQAT